jgi:hypothetical protein
LHFIKVYAIIQNDCPLSRIVRGSLPQGGTIMSKYELDHAQWHRLALPRLTGYLMPVVAFVVLVLWFRPQDELGWTAVAIGTAASFVVPLATLSKTRNQVHRNRAARLVVDESEPLSVGNWRPVPPELQQQPKWGHKELVTHVVDGVSAFPNSPRTP